MVNEESPADKGSLAKLSDAALIGLLQKQIPADLGLANRADQSLPVPDCLKLTEMSGDASGTPGSHTPASEPDSDIGLLLGQLAPPQQPDELARIEGYRILNVLGIGGMGIVFQAEDLKLNRQVAIKLIRPGRLRDRQASKRFLTEAQAAARLDHDHIVTVYHVGQHGDMPYLVMQVLSGESLASRLRAEGKLDVVTALNIARQVALGLAAAHGKGMLHRDIKPDNIWLDAASGRVKILDFGLAQLAVPNSDEIEKDVLAGTPNYIAPERIRGEPGNHRSDLFGVGVVVYEMLAGQKPFQASCITGTLHKAAQFEFPPLPSIDPRFDSAVQQLVDELLEKDPSQRIVDAAKLVKRIDEILQMGLADGAINSSLDMNRTTISRRTWFLGLIALGILTALVVSIFIVAEHRLDILETQRFELKLSAYPLKIAEANDAWKEGNFTRLGQILDELRPTETEPDLRGWEWNYLNALRHEPVEVVYKCAEGFSAVNFVGDIAASVDTGSSVIQIRNVATNELLSDIEIPGEIITALALSGDTTRVACCLKSERIEVWDIATRNRILSVASPLAFLSLNNSGDRLVSGADERITIYDIATGIVQKQFPRRYFDIAGELIRFSPDEKYCAIGLRFPAYLLIFETKNWKELARFTPYNGESNSGYFGISWHPDNQHIAVVHSPGSGSDGKVSIWNWSENQVRTEFPAILSGLGEGIATLAFDKFGDELAVGEMGGAMRIYNANSGELVTARPSNIGEFVTLSWSSDSQFVNAGSLAGAITRSECAELCPYLTIEATGRSDWRRDGKTIVSKSLKTEVDVHETNVKIFDPATGELLTTFNSPTGSWIPAIACCPVDDRIAYSSLDPPTLASRKSNGSIFVFKPGETQPELVIPAIFIKSLDWSPNGKYLVGGQVHVGHSVTVWDAKTGDTVWIGEAHGADVESVAWSTDGKTIASKDEHGIVVLWDPLTGRVLGELRQDSFRPVIEDGQWNLAFSPNSQRLAVGYKESLKIWDVRSKQVKRVIKAHSKNILAVSWSPDGKRIATGGRDSFVKIWHADTGQLLLSFQEESDVALVAFSPDGQYLATHTSPLGPIKIRQSNQSLESHQDPSSMAADQKSTQAIDRPQFALAPFSQQAAERHQNRLAEYLGVQVETTNSVGMQFRLIPPGKFSMGTKIDAGNEGRAIPQHLVEISRPHYFSTCEVTRGQFTQFVMEANYVTRGESQGIHDGFDERLDQIVPDIDARFNWRQPGFEQTDEHPVVGVNRADAEEFCKWISIREGESYRLPTEAEWEHACRAGTTGHFYWDERTLSSGRQMNLMDLTLQGLVPDDYLANVKYKDGHRFTAPAGSFPPNPFGLHDMSGNISEWCQDVDGPYSSDPQTNPNGATTGVYGLFRGGSWLSPAHQCYSSYRSGPVNVNEGWTFLGFRVVREVK